MMSAGGSKQVLEYPLHAPTRLEAPEERARLRQGCPVVVCNPAKALPRREALIVTGLERLVRW
jgi:hypothetical protein